MSAFWNLWRSMFDKKQVTSVADRCIADKFAIIFSSVCIPKSREL